MDKRTRVLNALNKQPVDHVPVGMWYHFSGEDARGEACVQAHLRYYRDTDLDFLKVMSDSYTYPISGIEKAQDWWNLQPLGADHPFIREQVWRAKRIVEEIGKERCVFYNIFAPFSCIRQGTSDELVMAHVRENPQAVLHALDVIAGDLALLCQLLITEAGCDGVYFCVQGAEKNRFTLDEYRRFVAPSDLYVLEHANRFSDNNILHCCGWAGEANNIVLWKDYPVKCVNWAVYVEQLNITEGRFFYGDKAVLGGFETLHLNEEMTEYKGLLYSGTKEEIQAYTKELILFNGKRGLLLGGDCTIASFTDHERVRWVVEAAREV
ncbi:MAG: hypothetical protein J6P72_09045 [Firmicutes bacterium]|nr:hypothetical protein [Bacillota bacterium]